MAAHQTPRSARLHGRNPASGSDVGASPRLSVPSLDGFTPRRRGALRRAGPAIPRTSVPLPALLGEAIHRPSTLGISLFAISIHQRPESIWCPYPRQASQLPAAAGQEATPSGRAACDRIVGAGPSLPQLIAPRRRAAGNPPRLPRARRRRRTAVPGIVAYRLPFAASPTTLAQCLLHLGTIRARG